VGCGYLFWAEVDLCTEKSGNVLEFPMVRNRHNRQFKTIHCQSLHQHPRARTNKLRFFGGSQIEGNPARSIGREVVHSVVYERIVSPGVRCTEHRQRGKGRDS